MKKVLFIIIIVLVLLLSTRDNYHKYIISNTIDRNRLETGEPLLEKLSKRPTIIDEVKSILYKYPSLEKNIKNAFIKVPSDEGFIPQGIEIVNSYIFITGYFEENRNSLCYILDESGKIINKVEFDMNSHVGGISYDKDTNLIFVPGDDDLILAYNVFDFLNKNNKKYMILSSSFGRIFSSNLYVYLYEEGKNSYENYLKKYTLPPMLEQISYYNNSLYLLFESNAYKYSNALDKINYIIEISTNNLIED